jgi:hypothetical protein
MNNDKYAKYSKGKVTYGANGAYTNSTSSSDDSGKGCMSMIILPFVGLAGLIGAYVTLFS